jgi:hypothetical protein
MVIKKRSLLWDWTNTQNLSGKMDNVKFDGPLSSVSNWNAWVPPELKGRAPFRPMIHLERELNGNEWQWILNSDQPMIHFFNEPERNGIDPQKAADYWHNQVRALSSLKSDASTDSSKGHSFPSTGTWKKARLAFLRLRPCGPTVDR